MIHLALEGSGQLRASFITRSILLNSKYRLLMEEDETGFLHTTDTNTTMRFNQFIQHPIIYIGNTLPFTACIQLFTCLLIWIYLISCIIEYSHMQ